MEKKQGNKKNRVILHIDMNAFYCSVHESVEPEKYKGKPLAVAGSEELRKGVIVTSSYPAREKGVKTGMLVGQAKKLVPQLIVIPPDFDLYRRFSEEFMEIAYQYSPLLEAASIDECYLDITGSTQFGHPIEIAKKLQTTIRERLGLPCSIGIGPNKLLAKMASDMKKPNGITILRKRDFPKLFWRKPTNHLFGIGSKTAEKLARIGIKTLGQLAKADERLLAKEFGIVGNHLKNAAHGIDHEPVSAALEANKSIGHTATLPKDIDSEKEANQVFLSLADQVGRRLRKHQFVTNTIQITIRYHDRMTVTRSLTLPEPTENTDEIYHQSCELFKKFWTKKPVRLLGITLQNLHTKAEMGVQLNMFDFNHQGKKEKLNQIVDRLRDKYGEHAIVVAGMLKDDTGNKLLNHKKRGTSLQLDYLKLKKTED